MKKLKLLSILVLVSLLALFLAAPASAAGTATLKITAPAVTAENQVTVTVRVTSSANIAAWKFSLKYDQAYLEYVSGADSGGGGAVTFADSMDNGKTEHVFSVVFRAKKVGKASLSIQDAEFVDWDTLTPLSVNNASATLTINPKPVYSSDNNLSSLTVTPGTLTPAFSPEVTQYSVTVPYTETKIVVSAVTSHNKATHTVSASAGELKVGENSVIVTVKAENGNTKRYVITVTRSESELAGVSAEVDGEKYVVEHDAGHLTPPAGYQEVIVDYGQKQILAFLSPENPAYPKDRIHVCFLHGDRSGWFLYRPETQEFTPMLTASAGSSTVILLPELNQGTLPAGFVRTEAVYQEKTVSVYATETMKEGSTCLVYALSEEGVPSFYYLDLVLGTVVSYFRPGEIESRPVVGPTSDPSTDPTEDPASQKMTVIALSLGLACVILAILCILTFVYRRKPKTTPHEDLDLEEFRPIRHRDSKK